MLGYKLPRPDEAMLISGGHGKTEGVPFRIIRGRGAFVMPVVRHASFLTLAMQEAEVVERCVTQQGIAINCRAVCAFKVATDDESIANAAQRFLSDQKDMEVLTGRIFAGHLRSIIGSMTIEQIVQERQKLAEEVLDASKDEMAKLGLLVDSFQIQEFDDGDQGYIAAMAAPHTARIQQAAKIAQAEANRAAAEAEQQSLARQAEYARDTAIAQAQYQADQGAATAEANQRAQVAQAKADAEVGRANAEAAQSGPLATAKAQRDVTMAQTELAEQNAKLRTQQLIAEKVAPAEADARARVAAAEADAKSLELRAAAAAANDRVSLDQQLLTQLPEIVKAAAEGLRGANVTILNGTDGMTEMVGGLLTQGMALLSSARAAVGSGSNGHVQAPDVEAELLRRAHEHTGTTPGPAV